MTFLHLNHMSDKKDFYISHLKRCPLIHGKPLVIHLFNYNRFLFYFIDCVITNTLNYNYYTCITHAQPSGISYALAGMCRHSSPLKSSFRIKQVHTIIGSNLYPLASHRLIKQRVFFHLSLLEIKLGVFLLDVMENEQDLKGC